MKRILLLLALLIASSCQAETSLKASPTPTSSARPNSAPFMTMADAALLTVLASPDSWFSELFPTSIGVQDCEIHGGGPYPGISVPGTCRTEVAPSGSNYVVTFTESWDAARFRYAGEPATGQLHHSWSFVVDAEGDIVGQSESGSFPPQNVM